MPDVVSIKETFERKFSLKWQSSLQIQMKLQKGFNPIMKYNCKTSDASDGLIKKKFFIRQGGDTLV